MTTGPDHPTPPHAIHIRPARADDTAALVAFLRALSLFPAGEEAGDTLRRVGRHLALSLAEPGSHATLLAEDGDGVLLGYVSVHLVPFLMQPGPEGFVSELFVGEGARGGGIGRRLLDAVVEEARGRGWTRLQLTNPRDGESYRRGFYAKAGWEERPGSAGFVLALGEGVGDEG